MFIKIRFEYRITAGYFIVGVLWILFSDLLLSCFIKDPLLLTRLQTLKGWFYVIITAILFYLILNRHLAKLRTAELKARESDRLKTAFLQNISHEIRTPMNSIVGFSDLLNEENLDETQKKEFLEIIKSSSNQLLNIVNEVLDISLIETGNTTLNEKKTHLNSLLDEIYSSFKPIIKKDISFLMQKGLTDLQATVLTDEIKLRQILTNLISNAVKFTDNGFIKAGYSVKNNNLEFFVEDSGIGIDPLSHDKIFNRFHKAESDRQVFYDGVGLGLSISKANVEMLNGKIWVKSVPDSGSTFFFTVPFNPVSESQPQKENASIQNSLFSDLIILIAEDDDPGYLYITRVLDTAGFRYLRALNGKEAVEICNAEPKVRIVLMDMKMPVMNGYDATVEIKRLHPGIKIIAQTAYAMKDEKKKALDCGCDDYISKPYDKEDLISVISNHFFPQNLNKTPNKSD
jgi:signal transduction histidine kinase/ActR/RegA family two-component response regulator